MSVLGSKGFVVVLVLFAMMTIAARDAMALSAAERRGRMLALRLCAQCHAIGKFGPSPQNGAPPFRHLDTRIDLATFQQRLRQGLMSGHPDMPEFRFTREDARAFVTYLRLIQRP